MEVKKAEKIMKGFANARRLMILRLLKKEREVHVARISELINLSYKSTSQHLRVLSNAELVESRQESLMVYYSLSGKHSALLDAVLKKL